MYTLYCAVFTYCSYAVLVNGEGFAKLKIPHISDTSRLSWIADPNCRGSYCGIVQDTTHTPSLISRSRKGDRHSFNDDNIAFSVQFLHCRAEDECSVIIPEDISFLKQVNTGSSHGMVPDASFGDSTKAPHGPNTEASYGDNIDYRREINKEDNWAKANNPIKIIMHGWHDTCLNESSLCAHLKNEYLKFYNYKVSMFMVDYSYISSLNMYTFAREGVKTMAEVVKKHIEYLVAIGYPMSRMHFIGIGVAAHIFGIVGHLLDGDVPRITGLDPAYPGFFFRDRTELLSQSDASFVDIIHTCTGLGGHPETLGHVDIWPNGGFCLQPGCRQPSVTQVEFSKSTTLRAFRVKCNSERATMIFLESLANEECEAQLCDSYKNWRAGKCDAQPVVRIGELPSTTKHGKYYMRTSNTPPFCEGKIDQHINWPKDF